MNAKLILSVLSALVSIAIPDVARGEETEVRRSAIRLDAARAELHGKLSRLPAPGGGARIAGWSSDEDVARWRVDIERAGYYDIVVLWSGGSDARLARAVVSAGGRRAEGLLGATGSSDRILELPLGLVELPSGEARIELRVHGAPEDLAVHGLLCEEGFAPLFDGKSLSGWQGAVKGYAVEDGKLVCLPRGGGNLYTKDEFSDFVLRFEFKLERGSNNGLGVRAPLKGDAAYVGMEIQILDDPSYKGLKPYQYHGSIYGVVPAKRGHLRPTGTWNVEEVVCRGRRVRVVLNGHVIVDADLDEASTPKTMDGRPHPGLKRSSGYIGFLGHGSRVEFRNIRVRRLDTAPKESR